MDLGHWQFKGEIPEDAYGFIYLITNNINKKKYIGKKQMTCIRKLKPLKGKKNKRHKTVETDWKTYTGSSDALNNDIKIYGKENFTFEILKICNSKSHLTYEEAKMQFKEDVLLKEDYYNGIINIRVSKIKI
jgi:hypothetical protein